MFRILAILFGLAGLVIAGAALVVVRLPPKQRPASTEIVERTPARLERGRYLVEHVLGCMDCHSKRDFTRFGAPPTGPAGAGGDCFGANERFPGTLCISNITPDVETGIGGFSDGEIKRAVREGVGRDGRALFPIMPYREYRFLSEEDTSAMVAYLRSLTPVKNLVPPSNLDFPVKYLIKLAPEPLAGAVPEPDRNDRVQHGKYLARVSGCVACHTPVDARHQPLAGQELSGGQEFNGPFGTLRSSNLTPHATGLGARDEAAFVSMFKAFDTTPESLPQVKPEQGTVMPWLSRAKMTEADLGAIFSYLKTVPAIDRAVEKRALPAVTK